MSDAKRDAVNRAMDVICEAYGIDEWSARACCLDALYGIGVMCGAATPARRGTEGHGHDTESRPPGAYPPQFYKALRILRAIYHTPPRRTGATPTGLAVEVLERMEAYESGNAAPANVPGRPTKCTPEVVTWTARHAVAFPAMGVTARVSAIAAHFGVSDRRVWEWRARGIHGAGIEGELVRAMDAGAALTA